MRLAAWCTLTGASAPRETVYSGEGITIPRQKVDAGAKNTCPRHPNRPCTCAMGHLYRFVEPTILLMLKVRGPSHGYDLTAHLEEYALTDAQVDRGQLYRTLARLEENGHVSSERDVQGKGPVRRIYRLTPSGEQHLCEWIEVLGSMSRAIGKFVQTAALTGLHYPSPHPEAE